MAYRIEKDGLGQKEIPANALYGIHSLRAYENFNISGKIVNRKLIHAIIMIKKAAAMTHMKINQMDEKKAGYIISACDDLLEGQYDDMFITDALQGGAGTSTNMNVNEVIANLALHKAGKKFGDYHIIHPINDVNRSQSTNDVYPTAIRISAILLLRELSDAYSKLQEAFQEKEKEFASIIKLGRTQLMDAIPITLGSEFGAYAQGIARDRWRLYKVEERLRQMNLGGTAVGTSMNADKRYIFLITDIIRDITGIGLARAEYPMDLTQNNDVFVEVSGLLKAAAVNLIKISNDIRWMNSGPIGGLGEITLKELQSGSSIMPGKVNPVIPEMVVQMSIKVIANDQAITTAASYGQFELNAFSPLIAESLLDSLKILTNGVNIMREKCIMPLVANEENCKKHLQNGYALATLLVPYIGYDKATELVKEAMKGNVSIKEMAIKLKILDESIIQQLFKSFE